MRNVMRAVWESYSKISGTLVACFLFQDINQAIVPRPTWTTHRYTADARQDQTR